MFFYAFVLTIATIFCFGICVTYAIADRRREGVAAQGALEERCHFGSGRTFGEILPNTLLAVFPPASYAPCHIRDAGDWQLARLCDK